MFDRIKQNAGYLTMALCIGILLYFLFLTVKIPVLPEIWARLIVCLFLCLSVLLFLSVRVLRLQKFRNVFVCLGCISSAALLVLCIVMGRGHAALKQVSSAMDDMGAGGDKKSVSKKQGVVELDWERQAFCCYISGVEGKKALSGSGKKARYSDGNLLAVVNPLTHTILLVNTPRDTLLEVPEGAERDGAGSAEKLDAMPLYGVQAPQMALEELYQVNIDCYIQINYTALKETVDALGGVEVYSECDFVSDWGPVFQEGENFVNGQEALAFARERHHLPDGDIQRGRNQQALLGAVLQKAWQEKSISLYGQLLSVMQENVTTNLSVNSMERLVQWQLEDRAEWTVKSTGITGEPSSAVTASSQGEEIYALLPDKQSVEETMEQIQSVLDGAE